MESCTNESVVIIKDGESWNLGWIKEFLTLMVVLLDGVIRDSEDCVTVTASGTSSARCNTGITGPRISCIRSAGFNCAKGFNVGLCGPC